MFVRRPACPVAVRHANLPGRQLGRTGCVWKHPFIYIASGDGVGPDSGFAGVCANALRRGILWQLLRWALPPLLPQPFPGLVILFCAILFYLSKLLPAGLYKETLKNCDNLGINLSKFISAFKIEYTGLFEMIGGVIRCYSPGHLVLQMQPHVISFYRVTSRIRFMFLLFRQVSRNWRLLRATNSLERTRLSCWCL